MRVTSARRILSLLGIATALLLVTSCWGGDESLGQTSAQKVQRGSAQLLTNQDWEEASSEPNNYVGSRVELKGRIFHVIGNRDGAFRFQMYTDPAARKGNTHVEWGGSSEGLKEGVDVLVTGTFKEIRVTTSAAGTELRIPSVAADSVEVLTPRAQPSPQSSPSPSPSPTQSPTPMPSPTLTVTVTPLVTPTPVLTPTVVVTATPSPSAPTPAPSATMEISPTAAPSPQPTSPTAVPTPTLERATPYPSPSPTLEPTPTAIRAPTHTPTPVPAAEPALIPVEQGTPTRVDIRVASIREPMVINQDSDSPDREYLETTRSDQSWDGVGQPPTDTGSATVAIEIPQEGRYAIWARMYYQHVDANSFWIRIDEQRAIKMGNEDGGYEQWKWVGWQDGYTGDRVVVDLSQGIHTLEIIGREEGARLDSIVITDDLSYVPQ